MEGGLLNMQWAVNYPENVNTVTVCVCVCVCACAHLSFFFLVIIKWYNRITN